jgi:hypothetical protein
MREIIQKAANNLWKEARVKMLKTVKFLHSKYSNGNSKARETGPIDQEYQIKVKADMTEAETAEDKKEDVAVSIGMILSKDEAAYLKVPNSMSDYEPVNVTKAVTDIARMATKIRRELRKRKDEEVRDSEGAVVAKTPEEVKEADLKEMLGTKPLDNDLNEVDFGRQRVTAMKSCRRVVLPKPMEGNIEAKIDTLVGGLEDAVRRQEAREKKTKPQSVYTDEELRGRESLKMKEKEGLGVLAQSDKSGKMTWIATGPYEEKMRAHTQGDNVIEMSKVDAIEIKMSAMSSSLARVLRIGEAWGHEARVQQAVRARFTKIPALDAMLKDHKEVPLEDLPVRPVCRASKSPNGILSDMVSDVLKILADDINEKEESEVSSTEEMCAKITKLNEDLVARETGLSREQIGIMKEVVVGSMDAKALYPSLESIQAAKIIESQILESEIEWVVDEKALVYHIAATHTPEEIEKRNLTSVCPKRRCKTGVRPGISSISITGTLKQRTESESWIEPDRNPTRQETRSLLAAAIGHAVKEIMANHVYTSGGILYLQTKGGSIGLRATGEISRCVCLRFDRLLREAVAKHGILQLMYGRYVDDSNSAYVATDPGWKFEGGEMTLHQDSIEPDREIPADERTLKLVQSIANSIWNNLQWTVDYPSAHPSKRMPVLDLQVGMQDRRAVFSFYEKIVATRYTIPARSAHSWAIKRATLTQEGVRRMMNTSKEASPDQRRVIMESWDNKMRISGYKESFRRQVISAAVGIFRDKLCKSDSSGTPLYRGRSWKRIERQREKDMKKSTWYNSKDGTQNVAPLILNPTEGGILKRDADRICNLFKETHALGIKIMERGGRKAKADATSDPKGFKLCARINCMICTTPGSKGGCRGQGMGYQISCLSCPNGKGKESQGAVYYGETGRSNYERGVSHLSDLAKEVEDSPLWKHSQLVHNSVKQQFKMETTGSFPSCEERQTNEGSRVKTSIVRYIMNSKSEWNQPPIVRITVDTGNLHEVQGGGTRGPYQGAGRSRARGRGAVRSRGRGRGAGA